MSSEAIDNLGQYVVLSNNQKIEDCSTTSSSSTALQEYKRTMVAIPAGLHLLSNNKSKGKKGKKAKGVHLVYNPIANRPLAMRVGIEQSITVKMQLRVMAAFTTQGSVPTYFALGVALNGLDSYSQYTGLFDQYKMEMIEAYIEPQSAGLSSASLAEVTSAVDLDDNSTPTSIGSVAGKQGSLTTLAAAAHYHKFKPHVAIAAYSGVFTSFANAPAPWIDCGSPAVVHYGLKFACTAAATLTSYNVVFNVLVSFRAPGL